MHFYEPFACTGTNPGPPLSWCIMRGSMVSTLYVPFDPPHHNPLLKSQVIVVNLD